MPQQKQVLVIDDEPAIRESVSELLKDEGYMVITAAHAGIAAIRAQFVDCIILDLQLSPGFKMEGGSVLTHLWEDFWCKTPVIIFSGLLGVLGIEDSLHQIEQVCGKGRNLFRLVPKSGGISPLIDAVNDCLRPHHG
jgi:CheY-like chemotaxis protein